MVTISNYDKYYFANEAVSVIFRTQGGFQQSGQGTLVKQIIAGVDEKHDFVLYIEVDKKANVNIKRFPIKEFKVNPQALKQGVY